MLVRYIFLVSVCPASNDPGETMLKKIRQNILCNRPFNIPCIEIRKAFQSLYETNFVILHRGEWGRISALSNFLTTCSTGVHIIEDYKNAKDPKTGLLPYCSGSKKIAIISVTNFDTNFEVK